MTTRCCHGYLMAASAQLWRLPKPRDFISILVYGTDAVNFTHAVE